MVGGTTEIQTEIIARSLGASGPRGSQVVRVPAAWRQAPVSAWFLKSLLRAVAAASARVVCTWAVAMFLGFGRAGGLGRVREQLNVR
jgi:hypothetical protein